jgi:hypothetical protein
MTGPILHPSLTLCRYDPLIAWSMRSWGSVRTPKAFRQGTDSQDRMDQDAQDKDQPLRKDERGRKTEERAGGGRGLRAPVSYCRCRCRRSRAGSRSKTQSDRLRRLYLSITHSAFFSPVHKVLTFGRDHGVWSMRSWVSEPRASFWQVGGFPGSHGPDAEHRMGR